MKNHLIRISVLIAALSLVALSVISCHKTHGSTATGTFYFKMHSLFEGADIDSSTYVWDTVTGHRICIKAHQFFVSGIKLTKSDGSTYTFPGVYILNSTDTGQYMIGNAPVGSYLSVSFNLALDAATNSKTPSLITPLGVASSSSMWYGNTTKGYIFMKLQGLFDTSSGHTGINPIPFSYEIGTDTHLSTISLPCRGSSPGSSSLPYIPSLLPYTLVSGGAQYIDLFCDFNWILSVHNLYSGNDDSTDTWSQSPGLADTLANFTNELFGYMN